MALTLTQITGTVDLPNGETPTSGVVTFVLKSWDKAGGNIFVPGPIDAPIALDGSVNVSLQSSTAADADTLYNVRVRYFSLSSMKDVTVLLPDIAVPASGPVTLASLLAIPAPVPNVPDALSQALAAAAQAEASAEGMEENADRAEAAATAAAGSATTANARANAAATSAQEARDAAASAGVVIASQAEAVAATDNGKLMTPLRTRQSLVGLDFTSQVTVATQAEAEAGSINTKLMTPLGVAQYVAAWFTGKIATTAQATAASIDTVIMTPLKVAQWFAAMMASQAEAEAGTVNNKIMTPLRTKQAMATIISIKAWVCFDGAATTLAVKGSANIASVTRSQTGLYVVTFTTAMPDANYSVVGMVNGQGPLTIQITGTKSAQSFTVAVRTVGTADLVNASDINIQVAR